MLKNRGLYMHVMGAIIGTRVLFGVSQSEAEKQ